MISIENQYDMVCGALDRDNVGIYVVLKGELVPEIERKLEWRRSEVSVSTILLLYHTPQPPLLWR